MLAIETFHYESCSQLAEIGEAEETVSKTRHMTGGQAEEYCKRLGAQHHRQGKEYASGSALTESLRAFGEYLGLDTERALPSGRRGYYMGYTGRDT
jgi:hypothetical protein